MTDEGCKLWLDFAGLDLEVIAQSVEIEESPTDSLPRGFGLLHSSVLTGLPVPVNSSDVAEEPIAFGSVYAMTWESESAGPRVWLRTGRSQFYCVDFERITELDMDISIAQSLPGSVVCHLLGLDKWSIQGAEGGHFRIHASALVNLATSTPAFPEDRDL